MNDDERGMRDDLAYLRAIAEEGRRARDARRAVWQPKLALPILLAGLAAYGAAGAVHWADHAGALNLSPLAIGGVWTAAASVYAAVISAMLERGRRDLLG